MIGDNFPAALILEDDSVFNLDLRALLAEFGKTDGRTPCVYLLTHRHNKFIKNSRVVGIAGMPFYECINGFGANGYVITRDAARNIRRFQTPIRTVADDWKLFLLSDLFSLQACGREIIGLQAKLSGESLLEPDRLKMSNSRARKRFSREIRRQIPFGKRLKYVLWKIFVKPFLVIGEV
jgi:GR25 family glycosyltransferase involved in LPS biosynthesis